MTNLWNIYTFELKKLVRNKVNLIALALGTVIIVLIPLGSFIFDGKTHTNGVRQAEQVLNGRMVNQALLDEAKKNFFGPESEYAKTGELKYTEINYPYETLLRWEQSFLDEEDMKSLTAENLYEVIQTVQHSGYGSNKLSKEERSFWESKRSDISTPYVYEEHTGPMHLLGDSYVLGFVLTILLGIGLAGLFSQEHHLRTDALQLASRYGRGTLYSAKILAGYTVALGVAALLYGVNFLANMAVFGMQGMHAPVQLMNILILYPWTFGKAVLVNFFMVLCSAMLLASLTMLLSLLFRNSAVTTGLVSALLIASMFSLPRKNLLFIMLTELTPIHLMNANGMDSLDLVPFFGRFFTYYQFAPVVYLLFAFLTFLAGYILYQRQEIGSR